MQRINWAIKKEDYEKINAIAEYVLQYIPADKMTISMDLTACHANAYRLDLDAMLNGDIANILHDVTGINCHLNRQTGEVKNFRPRYAVQS